MPPRRCSSHPHLQMEDAPLPKTHDLAALLLLDCRGQRLDVACGHPTSGRTTQHWGALSLWG